MRTKGLKLIGQGLFSKVYMLNSKQVLIDSSCRFKECLSMDWHSSTGVFPTLVREDDYSGVVYKKYYICKYYPKVSSLKNELSPAHYKIYKELRALSTDFIRRAHDSNAAWYKEFKKVSNKKYRQALLNMLDCLGNYGTDFGFEISPRNVAVHKGKLILLDVFFSKTHASEIRTGKFKNF